MIIIIFILKSIVTDVFGTRLLINMLVRSSYLKERKSWLSVKPIKTHDIKYGEEIEPTFLNRTIDIVKHQRKIFILTISMIVVGTASLLIFQLNPGIDFSSGSRVEILADESRSEERRVGKEWSYRAER